MATTRRRSGRSTRAASGPNHKSMRMASVKSYKSRHSNNKSRHSNNKSRHSNKKATVLNMTSVTELPVLNSILRKGPMTVVLVFSPTCTHCHSYMPLWDKMCALKDKHTNMVRVQSNVYDQTPLASKKSVLSVPTVLFVAPNGTIKEASEPRNEVSMTNAIKMGMSDTLNDTGHKNVEPVANMKGSMASEVHANKANVNNIFEPEVVEPEVVEPEVVEPEVVEPEVVEPEVAKSMPPGTESSPSLLHPVPATVVPTKNLPANAMETMNGGGRRLRHRRLRQRQLRQTQRRGQRKQRGGNPMAVAGPAALLLGAYSVMRSSGLGPPRRTRKRS